MNLKEWHAETVARMTRAARRLEERAAEARGLTEPARLAGKADGVKLGLSYMRDIPADAVAETGRGGFWDRLGLSTDGGGLPDHLPFEVDEEGCGPATGDDLHHMVCWCWDPACPLTKALGDAWSAGRRSLPLEDSLGHRIATALAKRHKCLDHNGPGSGPCRTDLERADLIVKLLREASAE